MRQDTKPTQLLEFLQKRQNFPSETVILVNETICNFGEVFSFIPEYHEKTPCCTLNAVKFWLSAGSTRAETANAILTQSRAEGTDASAPLGCPNSPTQEKNQMPNTCQEPSFPVQEKSVHLGTTVKTQQPQETPTYRHGPRESEGRRREDGMERQKWRKGYTAGLKRHRSVSSRNQESGHCYGHLNGFMDFLILG